LIIFLFATAPQVPAAGAAAVLPIDTNDETDFAEALRGLQSTVEVAIIVTIDYMITFVDLGGFDIQRLPLDGNRHVNRVV